MKPIKSEIRKAYLLNKYVIITPGRAKRPKDIKEETVIKRNSACPFCPDNITEKNILDKIEKNKKWRVLAIKNIFPAVSLDNKKAYGTQEVIVEHRRHTLELGDLDEKGIQLVLKMYQKRTIALTKLENIDYILCFKNQGSKAGASIVHAHSQVFATSIVPPDIHEEIGLIQAYKLERQSCPYCDIISQEMQGPRKIFEDKYAAAFAPYASEYHYEAWVLTKRHLDNITQASEEELCSLAHALKIILSKLNQLGLAFNLFLHQTVSYKDQHLYIKIQPRGSVWAGVELGSGLVINSVPPEEAALFYRD